MNGSSDTLRRLLGLALMACVVGFFALKGGGLGSLFSRANGMCWDCGSLWHVPDDAGGRAIRCLECDSITPDAMAAKRAMRMNIRGEDGSSPFAPVGPNESAAALPLAKIGQARAKPVEKKGRWSEYRQRDVRGWR